MRRAVIGLAVVALLAIWPLIGHATMIAPAGTWGASPAAPGHLKIVVALVDTELNLKPVPRHALTVRGVDSEVPALRVVTGLDGVAETDVEMGTYVVESERPIEFQRRSYKWRVTVSIKADETATLELSVDNASIEDATAPAAALDLPGLFKQWQDSVVTVWGDTGHGSGFLFDSRGLILTNEHVLGTTDYCAIQFDRQHKVAASVLAKDEGRDVAVLLVSPSTVSSIKAVSLGYAVDGTPPVVEGEQIFTIGSPLSQRKVMTTGIVSKIEPKAIISDININPGNSGGPLFTHDGQVVGITTFGEQEQDVGPGVSGIVRIDEARTLIDQAIGALPQTPVPSGDLLLVEPAEPFPVDALKQILASREIKPKDYGFGAGDYEVALMTPVSLYGSMVADSLEAAKEKAKRTKKGDAGSPRVNPLAELRNWAEYAGAYQSVLIVRAQPKLAESFWGGFARAAAAGAGVNTPAKLRFKTDFDRMRVLCGTKELQPIHPGRIVTRVSVQNANVSVNDVTYQGLYIFPHDGVGPHCGEVRLELYSEKEPNRATVKTLSPEMVKRIWDDFEPYRAVKR